MSDYYFVYIMANKSCSTLYIGMTNRLLRRVFQHRSGDTSGFTRHYNCHRLVHFERFDKPSDAIVREKQLKRWRREKKEALIAAKNPCFEDLAVTILGLPSAPAKKWVER